MSDIGLVENCSNLFSAAHATFLMRVQTKIAPGGGKRSSSSDSATATSSAASMDETVHNATAERAVASADGDLPSVLLPVVIAKDGREVERDEGSFEATQATATAMAAENDLHRQSASVHLIKKPSDHIVMIRFDLDPFRELICSQFHVASRA